MQLIYERLKDEFRELSIKIDKLQKFLASEEVNKINPVQRQLLDIQEQAMLTYKNCLDVRITIMQKEFNLD